jgi:molybdopterin/thiamine biosynthesis adenylyltransferase
MFESDERVQRYSRQIILKDVGTSGMEKLHHSTVTVIGAGGLGCPAIQMLATAGVGHIRVVDGDCVELSNLPRQCLHFTEDIGKPKVISIQEKVQRLNPDVELIPEFTFVTDSNIERFIRGSDYVLDATDNFPAKYLVNDTCVHLGIPFTLGGVVEFMGQLLSVRPGQTACYRCIFPRAKSDYSENQCSIDDDYANSCSGAGVMNTIPNFAGVLQAQECLKSLLGRPPSFLNRLFVFDLLDGVFDYIAIKKRNDCIHSTKN